MSKQRAAADARSVGELLLDADITARASLWDIETCDARGRASSWTYVVAAAESLWSSIPDPTGSPQMARISALTVGLHRTQMTTGWPGSDVADTQLDSVAQSLSRAADLVRGRRHPTAPLSWRAQLDADAARARLMHVLYVTSHGVGVALDHHVRELQRRLAVQRRLPAGESIAQARHTRERITVVERLAGTYLHDRWPSALAGEHRDITAPTRLDQALARWDLQAHRSLAAAPGTAALAWIARVQQDLTVGAALIGSAAARQGAVPGVDARRAHPALTALNDAWGRFAAGLAPLVGRQRRLDPPLLQAGREVQAALREITHDHGSLATPRVMASRVDLAATVAQLHRNQAAAVGLAHLMRECLGDPDLTVAARAAHAMSSQALDPVTRAPWIDAGSIHHNRAVTAPPPVRDILSDQADRVIDAARAVESVGGGLQRVRPGATAWKPSPGRREQELAFPRPPHEGARPSHNR